MGRRWRRLPLVDRAGNILMQTQQSGRLHVPVTLKKIIYGALER